MGVGAPHHCSLGDGSRLPSSYASYADARYIDAVIVSKQQRRLRQGKSWTHPQSKRSTTLPFGRFPMQRLIWTKRWRVELPPTPLGNR